MKHVLTIILFSCLLSSCASAPQANPAAVKVQATDNFADVDLLVAQKIQQYSNKQVLVVVDIDNTLLTTAGDLGGDIWYQWQRGELDIKPTAQQTVSCLFEDNIALLYELAPMVVTETGVPTYVRDWQQQGLTVFALTSRSPKVRAATERELARAGIDFSQSALSAQGKPVPLLREKLSREMSYMQGVMMTSGMNKGEMLGYLLDNTQRQFDAIIFVDDSEKNVHNLYNYFTAKSNLDMTIFHYTRIENHRKAAHGGVLTQNQAEKMAEQWQQLSATLQQIFPARKQAGCLSPN